MTHDPNIESSALDWVIRQRDPAFEDWEQFSDWLAQSPAHADAYHELAALDGELGDLPEATPPVDVPHENDNVVPLVPRKATRRAWLSGALAASAVAVVSIAFLQRQTNEYRIETAMGETQQIALADGSKISVNGGSSVLLDRGDPRKATVERGQALFAVVHRDDAPFRVAVGDAQLVDVGTVFDVTRNESGTVIAVSEGAVVYNPDKDNVRIDAGHRLTVRDGDKPELRDVNVTGVGGWQSGQLVYDGVPLEDVAAEISRTTGIKLRTAPGASGVLFRGALQTGTEPARLVSDLAVLSGTRATQDAGGWTLSK